MKAHLRSARIAPKKANLIAKMVRGMPVAEAMESLKRTHKKGARMIEELLRSAVANAEHNDKQDPSVLVIKTIVVNQSVGYRRGVPMARGRMRPMTKFLSHISVTLGIKDDANEKAGKDAPKAAKTAKKPSQDAKNHVKSSGTKSQKSPAKKSSSESSSASA